MADIDEQLMLALQVPMNVLEKDGSLSTGYDYVENKWEIIIKYSGDIDAIRKKINAEIEPLSYGYAVVILDEDQINEISKIEQIEYIEKPRRLYFQVDNGKRVSCIDTMQNNSKTGLFGEGVIVAIIDSGIDYSHPDFRNEDGTTRILSIWDQTIPGNPPKGFVLGTEYTREQINKALMEDTKEEQLSIVETRDVSGHGTHIAGIACGNGNLSKGIYKGVASKSDILVVKIGDSIGDSFPRTTRVMEALEYVIRTAVKLSKPIAINLSFGNNYGSHNGRSLLEQYIDEVANTWKNNICIGSGNEGESRKHIQGNVKGIESIELLIGSSQGYVSMQLWKNYSDDFNIEIVAPNGDSFIVNKNIKETAAYEINKNIVYVYYGSPTPIDVTQEINIIIYPIDLYIQEGIWKINLIPVNIVSGQYDIWLGSDIVLNKGTGFIEASEFKTLTIPSTAYNSITVGGYNGYTDSYASFSGTGDENYNILAKPDLVAPGVNIISAQANGSYESRTGTSMATPFVTGSVALLMEWGIVRGNDPLLYGQKAKAYLLKGARKIREFENYPNPRVGWGALCLESSFPDN